MNYKLNPSMNHLDGENYVLTFMRGRGFENKEQVD